MRTALSLHPLSRCPAVSRIDVQAARPASGRLDLTYALTGSITGLHLPPPGAPGRADELWRRTCFEAFVRAPPGEGYFEFNFAPTRQWAAYRFDGYRTGMAAVSEVAEPRLQACASETSFELRISLDLRSILPAGGAWRLGLSAVIEEANGAKSYWAAAHPGDKPDFHHSGGFVIDLAAPEHP